MSGNDTSAGATPAAGGATPPQSPPAQPAATTAPAAPAEPATGADDALGESGTRALKAERAARQLAEDRAKAAEKERDELKSATLSETEKAIAQARKDGATETLTKVQAQIRRSEVRAALVGAGISASVLDLAVKADEFAGLTIDGDGIVEGLEAAVTGFKAGHKDLFGSANPGGSSDGGARGTPRITPEQVKAWSKNPADYDKHHDEIMAWMAGGGR